MKNYLILFALLLIVLEFFFYQFIDNQMISSILIMGLVILSVIIPINYGFYLVLFILPNQRLFMIPGVGVSVVNFILLILLIRYALKNQKLPVDQLIIPILIIGYTFISSFAIHFELSNLIHSIKALILLIAFILFIKSNHDQLSEIYIRSIIFFVLGCLTASLYGIYFDVELTTEMIGTKYRIGGGEFNNANIFGFDLSYAIASLIYVLYMIRKKVLLVIFSLIALFVFGLLTQSRAFYFASFIILSFSSIIYFISLSSKKGTFAIIILLIAIAFLLYYIVYAPDSYLGIIFYAGWDRIINPKGGDITADRFYIWSNLINTLVSDTKKLLFGVGTLEIYSQARLTQVAHNAILEVIVSFGIIGFSLFISYFVTIWNYFKRIALVNREKDKYKINLIGYLPLIALLLSGITGHTFLGNAFLIKLVLSFLAILLSRLPKKYLIA